MSETSQQPLLIESAPAEQEEQSFDPVRLVLDALWGRFVIAGVLGGVLACIGAAGGYLAGGQMLKYESSGLIRIIPSRPVILYQTEFSERMPAYESYRVSQARLIRSQRLLDWAVSDDKLQDAGWPAGLEGLEKLQKKLSVEVPRNEEMIVVGVTHQEPRVAQVAADAVLRAYERLAVDKAAQDFASIEQELVRLRDRYRRERDEAREEVLRLAEQHGTDDLERQRDLKHVELQAIDSRILDLELALAQMTSASEAEQKDKEQREAAAAQQDGGDEAPSVFAEVPPEELAPYDTELSELVTRQRNLRMRLESLSESFGPEHREVRVVSRELGVVEREVQRKADQIRERLESGSAQASGGGLSTPRQRPAIEGELTRLRDIRENLAADVLRLGRTQLRIDHERQRAQEAAAQLSETNQRLEALRVEQGESRVGRAEVVQRAERALQPASDKRTQFAAAGFMGGFGVGVGLVALPGVIWRRYRLVRHVANRGAEFRLIGIIPELGKNQSQADELMQANLRQIANAVESEILRDAGRRSVYSVTSASAGEGKTSLVTALATVLARHGQNILVIDADPTGRALTSHFELDERPGLQELVAGTTSIEVDELPRIRGFTVLPVGKECGGDGRAMGSKDFGTVLERYASSFDAVLVDTGPILGCPESAAVAVNADRTLLVVARGQDENLVRATRDRLAQLGVTQFDVIFNRASRADVERDPSSVSASTARSSTSKNGKARSPRRELLAAAGVDEDRPAEHAA